MSRPISWNVVCLLSLKYFFHRVPKALKLLVSAFKPGSMRACRASGDPGEITAANSISFRLIQIRLKS